ncbi:MAG: hypothetical protein SFU98_03720 [Leptospiraceae bacterium]|nr:hypothetical protein [Leptospiraceae bacterium]
MRIVDEELKKFILESIEKNKVITLKTYLLSDYGEDLLKIICSGVLKKFGRTDLMDISYSAAKELVINATKANLKRALYRKSNLDIANPEHYERGMSEFKSYLTEEKIVEFKKDFKKFDLPVTATFYYNEYVLNVKVKNNFPLLKQEEERIRDKFKKATSFSSLIDFFMEFGDSTEGAGMGLTMVGILLDQSGISKHCFSLYSSDRYRETIAKIEIPLHKDYISKREMFEKLMKQNDVSASELRKNFSYNYKQYKLQPEDAKIIYPT